VRIGVKKSEKNDNVISGQPQRGLTKIFDGFTLSRFVVKDMLIDVQQKSKK
jgi:hypothetical protein